ncbi:hypothetical protein [Actinomadura sp. 6N118]|uniref:hypothetical protein n=1 Tax=Actinomadura sp. 6N118 TaxID=3375151 RepID=UPI0037B4BD79
MTVRILESPPAREHNVVDALAEVHGAGPGTPRWRYTLMPIGEDWTIELSESELVTP